jgi:hypothetical protein
LTLAIAVGKGHEHVSSGISIEVVHHVFLIDWVVIRLSGLSGGIDGGSHLVNVGVGVHVLPKGLSILGVITTAISLLGTVVVEWDTSGSHSEDESILEHSLVVILVKESGVIMVVNEEAKGIDIFEVTSFLVESVLDSVHGLLGAENISDCVVHWVVEQSGNWSLVTTDVAGITIENLSHLEHSRSWTKFGPEIFWNLWDSVDSNTIKAVGLDKVANPVLELLSNPLVLLVKIWEVSKSAVLNLPLVTPVLDVTLIVVVVSRIEWLD